MGASGEVKEAGEARRTNEPTRIRRKQPIFGDHLVDNDSRNRGSRIVP